MQYLPEVKDGQLVDPEVSRQERITARNIHKKKKDKLIDRHQQFQIDKALQEGDKNLGELNNEGHTIVTEDFEDSPHADRAPITEETE